MFHPLMELISLNCTNYDHVLMMLKQCTEFRAIENVTHAIRSERRHLGKSTVRDAHTKFKPSIFV